MDLRAHYDETLFGGGARQERNVSLRMRRLVQHLGIFSMLQWSFSSLAAGVWPSAGPDAVPFAVSDGERFWRRGHEMPFLGALLEIRGDWSEYCTTFGMSSWSMELSPCFGCHCTKRSMHDYRGCSIDSLPWALCTQEDYESACRACEQEVVVSRAQIQDMKPYLDYDKEKWVPGQSLAQ